MEDWNAEMQTKQLDEKWNKKAQHIAKQLGVPANIVSSEYVAMCKLEKLQAWQSADRGMNEAAQIQKRSEICVTCFSRC